MNVVKEKNIKLEFNIVGYERAKNNNSGILIDVALNPSIENVSNGSYIDKIKLDIVLINNLNTYEDILDSHNNSIYFDDYPLLKLLFNDEYELMNYLYDAVNKYAKENNIPLFFQDEEFISESYTDMIMESIKNEVYENEIVDSDDINDSYKLKWEISNYSIKLTNKYLERVYFEVNRNNINEVKLRNVLYKFWNEWNEIIPGKFKW